MLPWLLDKAWGLSLTPMALPWPVTALAFVPQQYKALVVATAQVAGAVADARTEAHAEDPRDSWTGVARSVEALGPAPSWPASLRPQHHRVPSLCTPQLWE